MGGVADQHHVAGPPTLVGDGGEPEPLRVVSHETGAVEVLGEQLLAEFQSTGIGLSGVVGFTLRCVESGPSPGLFGGLHDHRAHASRVGVAVRLERAVLGLLEGKGERLEIVGGAEPGISGRTPLNSRLEVLGELTPHEAVDAVGGDDEIEGTDGREILDLPVEMDPGSQLEGTSGEDLQEAETSDGAEAVTRGSGEPTVPVDLDVGPVAHLPGDGAERRGVGGPQVVERFVGEDHAETERVVGAVALVDGYFGEIALLEQDGGQQPSRTAADAGGAHSRTLP